MQAVQSLARCPSDASRTVGPIEACRASSEAHIAVRIYRPDIAEGSAARPQPPENVLILDFVPFGAPTIGRLPGWPTAPESALPPAFSFATREQAIAYARRHGWRIRELEPVLETSDEPDSIRMDNADVVWFEPRKVAVPRFPRVFP